MSCCCLQRFPCREDRGVFRYKRAARRARWVGSDASTAFAGRSSEFVLQDGSLHTFHSPSCCDPDTQLDALVQTINELSYRPGLDDVIPISQNVVVILSASRRLSLPSAPSLHSMGDPVVKSPNQLTKSHVLPWPAASSAPKPPKFVKQPSKEELATFRDSISAATSQIDASSSEHEVASALKVTYALTEWRLMMS